MKLMISDDTHAPTDQGAAEPGRRTEGLYKGGHQTTTSRHT